MLPTRPHLRDSWPDEGGADGMMTASMDVRQRPSAAIRHAVASRLTTLDFIPR